MMPTMITAVGGAVRPVCCPGLSWSYGGHTNGLWVIPLGVKTRGFCGISFDKIAGFP